MSFCEHPYVLFFFQAEGGIRGRSPSRGLGDVYNRQPQTWRHSPSIHYPTSMKSTLRTPLVFTATILIRMASPTCWQESLTRTSAQSTPCLDMPPKHPSKSLETNTQVRLKSMLDLALGAITASKRKIRQLLLFIVSFPIL